MIRLLLTPLHQSEYPYGYPGRHITGNVAVNKRTITLILVAYLTIIWAAVIFRIDQFPLTWVLMYSEYDPRETISVKVWDKEKDKKGFKVTYRDGSTGYVSSKDLNISKPHFRRLYYDLLPDSKIFETAPPKHKQGSIELGTVNRWISGLDEAERRFAVDREWRMFWTLNKTLGHEPSDPKFIIRIEADHQNRVYRKEDLLRQDIGNVQIDTRRALIEWRDEWLPRWEHGIL
jgi:hypothetical protein